MRKLVTMVLTLTLLFTNFYIISALEIPPPPLPPAVHTYQLLRPLGLFDEIEGNKIGVVSPQTVRIVQHHCDRWVQINSWLGRKWLDLEFVPPTDELTKVLLPFGRNMSVYFLNIETGYEFRHNDETIHFGASLSKAMLALMFYTMAEQGKVCLDTTVTFQSQHQNWGSGIIQRRYPLGTQFTLRRLIKLNLYVSDNVATLMLRDFLGGGIYGVERYRKFIESIGGNPRLVREHIMDSYLTANEVGIFAKAIHDYIESEGRYSEEFRQHLLNNQYPFLTRRVERPPLTASKTGWSRGVMHDMTIVYTNSPFILVVMAVNRTGTATGTRQEQEEFAQIYTAFKNFSNFWFPGE